MRYRTAIAIGFTTGCSLLGSTDGLSGPPEEHTGGDASTEGSVADGEPNPLADGEAHDAAFGGAIVLAKGQVGPNAVAVNGTHVFFSNVEGATIGSVPKGGGNVTLVSVGAAGPPGEVFADNYSVVWLVAKGTYQPFWSIDLTVPDAAPASLGNTPAGNSTFTRATASNLGYFALYMSFSDWGATLYVTQSKTWTGANVGQGVPHAAVLDGLIAYVAVDNAILVVTPSGSPTVLCPGQAVMDMTQDQNALYWLTADGVVRSVPKSATSCEPATLADKQSGPTRVAVDDTNVYFTSAGVGPGAGSVRTVSKAGGAVVSLATNLNGPRGLTVDATGVYVAVHDDGNVLKIPR